MSGIVRVHEGRREGVSECMRRPHRDDQGRIQGGGGGLGGQTPPPPFLGPPNSIKREKNVASVRKCNPFW